MSPNGGCPDDHRKQHRRTANSSNDTETRLDDPPGARKNDPVTASIDILAVAEALEESGMDTRQAHVCATQMHLVANARKAVTRPELTAALGQLKAELLERIAQCERSLIERIAQCERGLVERIAESERGLAERIAESERGLVERIAESERGLVERIAESERGLIERIAETERRMMDRMSMQYWRLVGTMTALLGLAVAAMRYLP